MATLTRNTPPVRRARSPRVVLLVLLALGALVFGGAARAAKQSYTYEADPIRLGMKALDNQDLDEAQKQFEEALKNEYQPGKAHFGLAEIKRRQGLLTEAETLYRQAGTELEADHTPDLPGRPAGLGLVLLHEGQVPEARAEFQKALDLQKDLWEAQYGMARVAIHDNDLATAQKLLSKGSGQKGLKDGEDLYHYGMGLLLQAQGTLDQAATEALKAFYLNPNDVDYGTLVADIYAKQGNRGMAISKYEEALAMPGAKPSAVTLHNLGVLYQQEKKYNDAIRRYIDAVKVDSTYAPAWKDMALLYSLDKRKGEEEAGAYLRYTRIKTDDPDGYLGLSQAYLNLKRFQPALDAAQKAYDIDSTRADVRLTLARASFQGKDKAKSARLYDSVRDTTKFTADDFIKLGQIKQEAKSLDAASLSFRSAIARDSTSSDAWYYLGFNELLQNNTDKAVTDFQKAITLDPQNASCYLNLGIARLKQKNIASADVAFRQVTRLAPKYPLGHVYLANSLLSFPPTTPGASDSLAAAVVEYKAARELDPKNAATMRGLGLAYLKQSNWVQAGGVLKDATEADANNADGWAYYGQALASQGSTAQAVQVLQKALAIDPNHAFAKKLLDLLKGSAKTPSQASGNGQ